MKKVLKRIWDHLEEGVTITLFIILMLDVSVQIISRVFFRSPLIFSEELARFLYIWIIFSGIGWVYKTRSNIALDLVVNYFSKKQKCIFDIVSNVVTIIAFAIMIYWGIQFVEFQWINPAPAMRFSMGIVYSIAPVSMAVAILRIVQLIIQDFKTLIQQKGGE